MAMSMSLFRDAVSYLSCRVVSGETRVSRSQSRRQDLVRGKRDGVQRRKQVAFAVEAEAEAEAIEPVGAGTKRERENRTVCAAKTVLQW